jgi:hypothetical protein
MQKDGATFEQCSHDSAIPVEGGKLTYPECR